jgi:hypothetical protein
MTQPAEPQSTQVALPPHRYPLWILALAVAIVLALVLSLVQLPPYYRAASLTHLAEIQAREGQHANAARYFVEALDKAPDSRRIRLGLAIALFHSTAEADRQQALQVLKGVELDSDEWRRVSAVMPPGYQQLYFSSGTN